MPMTRDADFDVIVAGAGTSGVAAAVSAARAGARVLLIERYGMPGGALTAALVAPMMTFHSAKEQVIRGIAQEIVDRLAAMGMSPGHVYDASGYVPTITPFDTEAMKQVELAMLQEAGVNVLLHSQVVEATVKDCLVRFIKVQCKEGLRVFTAAGFVDATGDADLAFCAGVPCDFGRREDGLAQPVTLMFKMTHVDIAAVKEYAARFPEEFRLGERGIAGLLEAQHIAVCGFFSLLKEARAKGEVRLHRDQVLFFGTPFPDEVIVNMTRVTNVQEVSSQMLTHAEIAARRQTQELADFFRRRIPGFSHARIVATGAQIGVRETRRVQGLYCLNADEIIHAAVFADQIAINAYPIDIHSPDGAGVITKRIEGGKAYGVPLRCLLNAQAQNLLITGRAISTTHEAQASTRLSPICMALGQAAGVAAALAAQQRRPATEVDVRQVQLALLDQGAELGAARSAL